MELSFVFFFRVAKGRNPKAETRRRSMQENRAAAAGEGRGGGGGRSFS